jgi:hypothetical protein
MTQDVVLDNIFYHQQVMVKLIRENRFKKIAEIGIYKAGCVKYVLRCCHEQIDEYWGVDEYSQFSETKKIKDEWKKMYWYACRYMPFYPKLKLLKLESAEAAKLFQRYLSFSKEKGYFDFVFIDATHTYPMVKRDILLWKPLIKPGGVISGHDYGFANTERKYSGVQEAVDEVFGVDDNVSVNRISGVWWVRC